MRQIPYDEETTRDWDWFAVDPEGFIGHFTTAGFRRLPESVRADWDRAEELIQFFEATPELGQCEVRPEFWGWEKALRAGAARERYFRCFKEMARRGLYSYDTVLRAPGDYFGVAIPNVPLAIAMLPEDIQRRISKTRATIRFRDAVVVPEAITHDW